MTETSTEPIPTETTPTDTTTSSNTHLIYGTFWFLS